MEEIAQKIKAARQKKGLSIAEISEKTKIRPHVIEAFENNNFSVMPAVYVKSFLKTLFKELDIKGSSSDFEQSESVPTHQSDTDSSFKIKPIKSDSIKPTQVSTFKPEIKSSEKNIQSKLEINPAVSDKPKIEEHPLKQEFRKKKLDDPKPPKKAFKKSPPIVSFDSEEDSNSVYTEIFKNNNIEKRFNFRNRNLILIILISLFLATAAYFIIIHDIFGTQKDDKSITALTEDSAVVITSENKDLFSSFIPQEADSIILRAKSIDTAWLSLDIDGKFSEQTLMKPGMDRRWSAKEYIIITQGNAGAIEYFRNNELLQPFGTKGTVVRNIKITMNEVLNATQVVQDSLRRASNTNAQKPKKEKREIRRIEPSKIEN